METSIEIQPLEEVFKINYYTLLFGEDLETIKQMVLKFTEEENAKEIFLTKYNNNILIRTIFIKKYLSKDIIERIFKIFNYKDFKKYKILNIMLIEYFLIFLINMKKYKINLNLFLVQDKQDNTPLHNIINHTSKKTDILQIWEHIDENIKNQLLDITNNKGCTIYYLASYYNIELL